MNVSVLKKIGIICIELALIGGLLLYISHKNGLGGVGAIVPSINKVVFDIPGNSQSASLVEKNNPFPSLQDEVLHVFHWEYKGIKYELNQKMYTSVFNYYASQPKTFSYTGQIKTNWEEDYYGMFLAHNPKDTLIAEIVTSLQNLGKRHNLNDDEIVDLTLAFVQAIKYDDAKAENILAKSAGENIMYPYETLFKQTGVCSDKSLLAIALLREMGYGTVVLAYEDDNHMAIGVQCPKDSSTYGSGYCYSETTSTGNKIGIIPSFDVTSNKTVGANELSSLDSNQSQQAKLKQLGQVTMYQKTTGREYFGILITKKIIAEMDALKKNITLLLPLLQDQKKNIIIKEKKLAELKKTLESYKNGQSIEKYNALVGEYNDFLKSYKKDVEKYNESVALYNKSITRYNTLIKQ
jgi:hypothetical protein